MLDALNLNLKLSLIEVKSMGWINKKKVGLGGLLNFFDMLPRMPLFSPKQGLTTV